jgi:hypothetical protein
MQSTYSKPNKISANSVGIDLKNPDLGVQIRGISTTRVYLGRIIKKYLFNSMIVFE